MDAAPKQIEVPRRSARFVNEEQPMYAEEPSPKESARRRKGKAKVEEKPEAVPNGKKQGDRPLKQAKMESEAVGGDVQDTNKSWKLRVKETLRDFNSHYFHFVQEERRRVQEFEEARALRLERAAVEGDKPAELKEKRPSMRPDLKAITKMWETRKILYPEKRIGHLPGIDVGDQFYSRAEMVVLGIHSHWLNGIDYMGKSFKANREYKNFAFPLATCIVMSGMYEDNWDNLEEIIYTGQGGNDSGKKCQTTDQMLTRGNLTLENSMDNGNAIRVVRGHEAKDGHARKVYTYDGLYEVVNSSVEKGCSGYAVYQYKLKRQQGRHR